MSIIAAIAIGASVFLAAVFAYSGGSKLLDGSAFERTLREVLPRGSSDRLAPTLRIALPLAELCIAAGLLTPLSGIAAAVAAALLLVFSIVALLPREKPIDCACFGKNSSAPLGAGTAARNAGLIAVSLAALAGAPGGIWQAARAATAGHLLLIAVGTAAGLLIAWQTMQLSTLRRRFDGELALLRESQARLARTLSGGTPGERPIPSAQAQRTDGTWMDLTEVVANGPQLMLFALEDCPVCHLFAELVPSWRERLGDSVEVSIAYKGRLARARQEYPGEDVVVFDGASDDVFAALGIAAFPAVLLLGGNGLVATDPIHADVQVDSLIDELVDVSQRGPRRS